MTTQDTQKHTDPHHAIAELKTVAFRARAVAISSIETGSSNVFSILSLANGSEFLGRYKSSDLYICGDIVDRSIFGWVKLAVEDFEKSVNESSGADSVQSQRARELTVRAGELYDQIWELFAPKQETIAS